MCWSFPFAAIQRGGFLQAKESTDRKKAKLKLEQGFMTSNIICIIVCISRSVSAHCLHGWSVLISKRHHKDKGKHADKKASWFLLYMSNYLGPNSKWTYCNHIMMPTVDKALGFKPDTRVDTNKDIPLLVYGIFLSVISLSHPLWLWHCFHYWGSILKGGHTQRHGQTHRQDKITGHTLQYRVCQRPPLERSGWSDFTKVPFPFILQELLKQLASDNSIEKPPLGLFSFWLVRSCSGNGTIEGG